MNPVSFGISTGPQGIEWQVLRDIWKVADDIDLFETGWVNDHFFGFKDVMTGHGKPHTVDCRLRLLRHGPKLSSKSLHTADLLVNGVKEFLLTDRCLNSSGQKSAPESLSAEHKAKLAIAKRRPLEDPVADGPVTFKSAADHSVAGSSDDFEVVVDALDEPLAHRALGLRHVLPQKLVPRALVLANALHLWLDANLLQHDALGHRRPSGRVGLKRGQRVGLGVRLLRPAVDAARVAKLARGADTSGFSLAHSCKIEE